VHWVLVFKLRLQGNQTNDFLEEYKPNLHFAKLYYLIRNKKIRWVEAKLFAYALARHAVARMALNRGVARQSQPVSVSTCHRPTTGWHAWHLSMNQAVADWRRELITGG